MRTPTHLQDTLTVPTHLQDTPAPPIHLQDTPVIAILLQSILIAGIHSPGALAADLPVTSAVPRRRMDSEMRSVVRGSAHEVITHLYNCMVSLWGGLYRENKVLVSRYTRQQALRYEHIIGKILVHVSIVLIPSNSWAPEPLEPLCHFYTGTALIHSPV